METRKDDPELKMVASDLYGHRGLWLKETPYRPKNTRKLKKVKPNCR